MARLSLAEVGLLLLLVLALVLSAEASEKKLKTLRRKKREWILPPAKLSENKDYTQKPSIAKIRSDKDKSERVEYYLSGPGADKPPFNLFVVNHETGFVRITGLLDREKKAFYNLTGKARYMDGNQAEEDIPLNVVVLDENDNAPYFELHTGNVTESSKKGTFIMQIVGKDDDQEGTINSEISYKIISQVPESPARMFDLDSKTGKLYVKDARLDRETCDYYKLVVQGADLRGAAGGLTGTGTVEIKVLDINDNKPILEKSEYKGSVDENVADVIVMRIKALDADLEPTDNWKTVFKIVKGNEDNRFAIETDEKTNEGILKLVKPLDFEEVQKLALGLSIENVAPFVEGGAVEMDVDVQVGEGGPVATGAGVGAGADADAGVNIGVNLDTGVGVGGDAGAETGVGLGLDTGLTPGVRPGPGVGTKPGVKPGTKPKQDAPEKTYPILISVNNMPEGPAFRPDTKIVPVSEDPNELPKDGVLTSFPAIDPDTGKQAEDVSYAKAHDPDNWLTIDEETAEIKLNKAPDRESPFLVNGTYVAKILAITKDVPSKTATGTIAIQVNDFNDHCPTLTTSRTSLCSDSKTVYVTGIDEDVSPNAAPFKFTIIPDGTRGKWDVKTINDTSAALHSHEMLWPGEYKLQVEVTDAKGLSCAASEPFTVEVCDCVEKEGCGARTARLGTPSSELSASAIGLLLMALCLLLLIPLLLLFCQCGGADTIFPDQFSDIPFDAKEHLISYHTEGRGEDKEVPLQSVPIMMSTQKKVEAAAAAANFNSAASKITETHQTSAFYESVQQFQDIRQSLMEVDNAYGFSRGSFNNSSAVYGRPTLGIQRSTTALYEDIALPDAFLNAYYSQKADCVVPVKDSLLDYGFEGQGSPTGSVGCCSLLESDNDLQFLNDLGSKFKTLAEICSPPTPTPKPSLTHKVTGGVKASVDIVEPVVRPKIEHNVETRHTDIKTEKVMSSTNISKSSVSTVSTAPQSMTLPRTNVTNISQSSNISQSNISHSATLPRQAQTVILQRQPVYYTTSPVLQPMHYVVQPQLQNTVLLANGAQGVNVPGFYVVSGPQNPSSGLVISGPPRSPSGLVIQGTGSPKSPASPASPVSPTLLLPGSPGVSQGTVPAKGWKMEGPNPDGSYMLVMDKSSPGKAEGVDPGSSQGTLPRGAILVKEAAPPQGVLGPAAQGSVYGILPGHTVVKNGGVVAVNSNLGQTWVRQPGQMGLRPVNILGVGAGKPRMGHVVTAKPEGRHTGIWPPGINSVGIRQISVNQSQGIPPMEQTRDPSGISKGYRIESPKEDKTTSVVNTVITTDIITAEVVKTNQSPKEEVMTKKLFMDDSDPTQNTRTDTVEEQQDVISKASEHDPALNDEEPSEVVQEYQTQTSEKSSIADLEEDIVKSLPGSDVLQTSFEQSDTVVEKLGDTKDEIVPDQLNKITEAPTNTFTDVESQTAEANDPQQNIEEEAEAPQAGQQENLGPAEGYSKEDVFMVTEMSSTEALQCGSDVSDLGNTDVKDGETSAFHQGEEATSTSDHLKIVDDQIHDSTEENVCSQEAAPLKEEEVEEEGEPVQLSTVAAPEVRSAEVESESQSNQVSEDQSDRDLEQDVSPAEEVVSVLETNQVVATSDSIQAEEIMEERTTVTSDTHENVKAKQDQMLDSDVELDTVDAQPLATAPNEISMDTLIVSEERSIPDQEAMPELEVDRSEGFQIGEGHAQRDIVDAEARTSLQTGSIILANQEEGDLGDSNLISASEEITTQVQAEGSTVPTISTLEQHQQIAEDKDDDDDQQHITSESGEDKDQVSADTDSVSDGDKEGSIVEEGVSQQSFSTSDDHDEDIERQDGLSTSSQLEENFISDDNTSNDEKDEDAVEETVSPVQQNISSSDDQDEKSAKEDASSTSSQVDDTVMSDDNINGPEKEEGETLEDVTLPIQQNVSITHYQDEEIEGEDVSGSSLLEDQLVAGDDIDTVETEDHIAEKVTSPIQPLLSITNDQDEEIGRVDAGHATSTVKDQLISEDNTGDGAQEVSPVEQTTLSSDEDSERECASHTVSQVETKLISDVDGEKEEIEAPSIHQNICISGDQDEDSEEEGAPGTSSHIREEGIKSYQLSEEESQPLDTECLSAMSKVTDTQEMPSEITTHQVRQGLVSSQTGEIPLDIAERHILVRDANMEGLDDVVTSSGELISSRVATGQVYTSSEDEGVSGSILASGQSASGDLTLEKGNVEATFDPEIRAVLDGSTTHASGQVLPVSSSEIEVVGKTISSMLETDPGSADIGTASFIATNEVADEAGDLVQNESVHITGEAAEIGPNTVGNAALIDVESKASDYMHGAEASGAEVSPVQTVISQTQNKFRRSKKDSSKKPRSPKSPSGKCKQQ